MKTPEIKRGIVQTLKDHKEIPPILLGSILALSAVTALYYRVTPSVEAVTARVQSNAREGRLLHIYPDGENSYLSFPADGVVKINGAFDPALAEVGKLCGVPTSIAFWRNSDIAQLGYVTVREDSCLAPLKAELAQIIQSEGR